MDKSREARTDIIEIDSAKLIRMQTLHVAFLLFDVRNAKAYETGHINGALNIPDIPAGDFLKKLEPMVPKKDTPIVIYDADGVAAADLVFQAEKAGFINIVNLEGGYEGYLTTRG